MNRAVIVLAALVLAVTGATVAMKLETRYAMEDRV